MVSGIYMLQEEIDQQYAFTHLDQVQALTGQNGQLSAIELKLHDYTLADETKKELQQLPGASDFKIETRYEQNRTLYFIMQSERWAVFAILTLMLIIASFNIIGSLSMLVIEKEKDIAIFQAMGMNKRQIRNIFLLTGMLMAMIGAGIGSILALVLLWGQQTFGWIKLGQDGAFLIEAYPVDIQAQDFVLIYSTVLFLAMLASFIPAIKASKKSNSLRVR
jgi:lipoprotein-releasing system permease protein